MRRVSKYLGLIAILVVLFFVTTESSRHQELGVRQSPRVNVLAQISAIETKLLKEWQQQHGLNIVLSNGQSGYTVRLLQKMLSSDDIAYPEKKITGYFGDTTTRAVKKFQKEYGLPETGTVDEATRLKLNEIFLSHLCPDQSEAYPELILTKVGKVFDPLPDGYVPPSLTEISRTLPTMGIVCVRGDVAPFLKAMFDAAAKDGARLMVTSGYRTPEIQQYLYDFWKDVDGSVVVNEVATPRQSEHELGSTVDLTDESSAFVSVNDNFATSTGGIWLRDNAYKYGFTMSFPEGFQQVFGYRFEPWHWRFVGVTIAKKLREQNIIFDQSNFDDALSDDALHTPSPGMSNISHLFERDLYFGLSNDADVRALQDILAREGFYHEEVTGNFDDATRNGVLAFQIAHDFIKVSDNGYVGTYTRKVLNDLYRKE